MQGKVGVSGERVGSQAGSEWMSGPKKVALQRGTPGVGVRAQTVLREFPPARGHRLGSQGLKGVTAVYMRGDSTVRAVRAQAQ